MTRPNKLEQITNPDAHSIDNSFESNSKTEGNLDVSGNVLNSPEGDPVDYQAGVVEVGGTAISLASEKENSKSENPNPVFKARSEREELPDETPDQVAERKQKRVKDAIIEPNSAEIEAMAREARPDGGFTPDFYGSKEEDDSEVSADSSSVSTLRKDTKGSRFSRAKSRRKLEEKMERKAA